MQFISKFNKATDGNKKLNFLYAFRQLLEGVQEKLAEKAHITKKLCFSFLVKLIPHCRFPLSVQKEMHEILKIFIIPDNPVF